MTLGSCFVRSEGIILPMLLPIIGLLLPCCMPSPPPGMPGICILFSGLSMFAKNASFAARPLASQSPSTAPLFGNARPSTPPKFWLPPPPPNRLFKAFPPPIDADSSRIHLGFARLPPRPPLPIATPPPPPFCIILLPIGFGKPPRPPPPILLPPPGNRLFTACAALPHIESGALRRKFMFGSF